MELTVEWTGGKSKATKSKGPITNDNKESKESKPETQDTTEGLSRRELGVEIDKRIPINDNKEPKEPKRSKR